MMKYDLIMEMYFERATAGVRGGRSQMAIKNSKIGPNGDQAIKSGTFFTTATKKVVEPRKVDFF